MWVKRLLQLQNMKYRMDVTEWIEVAWDNKQHSLLPTQKNQIKYRQLEINVLKLGIQATRM